MAQVKLNALVKSYGRQTIVKGIDLQVNDGEFIVLVGPSGCGKSTTLRMIAGLEDINSGSVEIGQRIVNDLQPHLRNIAMVFQNYALYPHKTVRENIVFGLKKAKMPATEREERLLRIATMLQLTELLDRMPADLSGGQRQRVAMGRALVRDADVFLFDEPLSNLDAKLRHHMRTEIARIHQRLRSTSIYVTHDQVEAMTLADRVVVMRDGEIEQVGTPMEIYLNPVNTFVASFIGSPAMNLLPARFNQAEQTLTLADRKLPADLLAPGLVVQLQDAQAVLVGIRPDFFDDASLAADQQTGWRLDPVEIELVEPLGFDKEIIFNLGELSVKARLDLRSEVRAGEQISLLVDANRLLLFDTESGHRISQNSIGH